MEDINAIETKILIIHLSETFNIVLVAITKAITKKVLAGRRDSNRKRF
jgi:hypothetical protein